MTRTDFPLTTLYVLVNYGRGSRVLEEIKKLGHFGGTILSAKGTIKNNLLRFLSLADDERELVAIATTPSKAAEMMATLDKVFHFDKPGHGIAFCLATSRLVGSSQYTNLPIEYRQETAMSYQLLTIIVERGQAEEVVEATQKAGAPGGTILNGRGASIHETSKVFNMVIEPEKEVVWLIVDNQQADTIITAIDQTLDLSQPGHGILFAQPISSIRGLY